MIKFIKHLTKYLSAALVLGVFGIAFFFGIANWAGVFMLLFIVSVVSLIGFLHSKTVDKTKN